MFPCIFTSLSCINVENAKNASTHFTVNCYMQPTLDSEQDVVVISSSRQLAYLFINCEKFKSIIKT